MAWTPEQIADFALGVSAEDLGEPARSRLKLSLLDGLGCAIGALGAGPVAAIRAMAEEFGGNGRCTLIGGGASAPDRAALVNGCLVRYLDFMDNYAAPGEVCHPIDNFAALLAAAEYAGSGGEELLLALAVACQVQCRLLEILPTMRAGLNYTTPLAFSVAAGASRLLGLDRKQAVNALALAGVGAVSLAVIQAEPVSHWKGLASGEVASRALHNTFLAARGITGPIGVFDGPFGLDHLVHAESTHNWASEVLDASERVSIKKYNAEFQSQAAVDAAIELRRKGVTADTVDAITLEVADGAYNVIGGGSYGPKTECHDKEQADHNLRYLVAVALLDGDVQPAQFAPERINSPDVQGLLRKVTVRPNPDFSKRIPREMPAWIEARLADGRKIEVLRTDYPGFHTRPMAVGDVRAKFDRLTGRAMGPGLQQELVSMVDTIESARVADLAGLLARVGRGQG